MLQGNKTSKSMDVVPHVWPKGTLQIHAIEKAFQCKHEMDSSMDPVDDSVMDPPVV